MPLFILLLALTSALGFYLANTFRSQRQEQEKYEVEQDDEDLRRWFLFQRAYPFNSLPPDAGRVYGESFRTVRGESKLTVAQTQQAWRPIGPTPITRGPDVLTGRIGCVAVSPAKPSLILLGGATGGIWRSADGGARFDPVIDEQTQLGVSQIVFSGSNPEIVYAAVGARNTNFLGSGVLKSSNGGQTWARVSDNPLPQGGITGLAVDPSNPNRVYLAEFGAFGLDGNLTARGGFFLSTDGGLTWGRTFEGNALNLAMQTAAPQTLYMSIDKAGVLRSTDGGGTWVNIFRGPFDSGTFPRMLVAVSNADAQKIYAFASGVIGNQPRNSLPRLRPLPRLRFQEHERRRQLV
jgi:photosystem II stability/assembly factor-like uncharacterized protein